MLPRITKVQVLGAFRVALDFTDGSHGIADLGPTVGGHRSAGGV